jgi:predicted Zn-dependent peptidase
LKWSMKVESLRWRSSTELTALLFRELEKVKEAPFEETILDKVREQQRRSFEEAREENRFWTAVMREAELYNLPYETILDMEALIEEVTAENILNLAGEVLRFDRYVLGTLYPRRESAEDGEK